MNLSHPLKSSLNPHTTIFKKLFITTMAESMSTISSHFISIIGTCKTMDQLKQIHSQTIRTGLASDSTIQKKLLVFCCTWQGGDMGYARKVFETMPEPNVFAWNKMIKGYSRVGSDRKGVIMYADMLKKGVMPDGHTFPFLLKGFTRDAALVCGMELHCHVVKFGLDSNVYVHNALLHMYSLCGLMDMVRAVFGMRRKEDVFAWNVMLSGYNRMKRYEESKTLFGEMERNMVLPNSVTLLLVLSACSKLKDKDLCRRVHGYVKERKMEPSLKLENALINAYAVCGEMDTAVSIFKSMKTRDVISWTSIVKGFVEAGNLELARKYFDQMPKRDNVSWTAMIDGYLRANCFKESLELFRGMQDSSLEPDEFTMVSVLTACAHLGALEIGEWIKTYIDRNKIQNDVFVGNALIDMYFKCGCAEKAQRVFNEMSQRDKFTWTAMVVGLANNGHGEDALEIFSQMLDMSIEPDEITYLGILSACTHTGMVDQGRKFFARLIAEDRIEPRVSHYGCMVDLLGRAGQLKEAYELIINMPMKPNSVVWGALLGACKVRRDVSMAEMAAKKILELEPDNGAVYVSLCNIYAARSRWDDLSELRRTMLTKGIKKIPGCSLIEMNGIVHEFVARDRSHPQSREIYMKLEEMTRELKLAGYSPDTSELLMEVGEEDRHSRLV